METTTAGLSEVLGIGARQIQILETQGVLVKLAHGQWHLPTNVQAWAAHKARCEVTKLARSPAEERLAAAKADAAELKVERERDAHRAEANEAAIRVCDEVVGPLKSDLYAIPARVTGDLALRRKLEDQFDVAFSAAADRADSLQQKYQGQIDAMVSARPSPNRAARRAAGVGRR